MFVCTHRADRLLASVYLADDSGELLVVKVWDGLKVSRWYVREKEREGERREKEREGERREEKGERRREEREGERRREEREGERRREEKEREGERREEKERGEGERRREEREGERRREKEREGEERGERRRVGGVRTTIIPPTPPQAHALEDLVVPGMLVAVSNLSYQGLGYGHHLPSANAGESSVFSQHPREQHLKTALQELLRNMPVSWRCMSASGLVYCFFLAESSLLLLSTSG